MEDVHDYLVARLTIDQIERRAEFFRRKWDVNDQVKLNVFSLLFVKLPEHLERYGLKLIPRRAGPMGMKEAVAKSNPKRIFYRDRLLAKLRFGDREASFIFLHELAHVVLHSKTAMAWMTEGNLSLNFIEEECSAEWQATMLALCLAAPASLANDCVDWKELGNKFDLRDEDAQCRFEILKRRRPKKLAQRTALLPSSDWLDASVESSVQLCPDCGFRLLNYAEPKPFCNICYRASSKYQDGD